MADGTESFSPSAIMTVFITGIPIVTLIANLPAVLKVIWITVRTENVKNLHLCSVGITDAFVVIFAYLVAETFIHTDRQLTFYNCCFRYYMYSVTFVASMLHVLGICIQRLKILTSKPQPQQNQRIIEWVVIVTSWLTSAVIITIGFVLWRIDSLFNKFHSFWIWVTFLLLPWGYICYCYISGDSSNGDPAPVYLD